MNLFETDRLIVRTMLEQDVVDVRHILMDEHTMKYIAAGALSSEQIPEFVKESQQTFVNTGFGHWPIRLKTSSEVVGLCGLNRHSIDGSEWIHINYRLGSKYQKRGYATEVVEGLVNYSSKILGVQELAAIISPKNIDSINVAERCHFRFIKQTVFKNMPVLIYQKLG